MADIFRSDGGKAAFLQSKTAHWGLKQGDN
jgi:hypothetical protein